MVKHNGSWKVNNHVGYSDFAAFLCADHDTYPPSQFSRSVMSDSLWPHGLQQAGLRCPSSTPGACSHSCPSGWWCHPTISSSVVPFSSCFLLFPAPGSFPVGQLFVSGGQIMGASTSASVLPMNIQGWLPFGLLFWSPYSPRDSQEFSPTP